MKKLFFVVSILFLTSLSLFSEEWRICFGEYKTPSQAEVQEKVLAKQGIPTKIEEYKKNSSEILYRVLSLEILPTRQAAVFQKELLSFLLLQRQVRQKYHQSHRHRRRYHNCCFS